MFCSKCGRKLIQGYPKCRNCGEPAENAEYCGGFWGLVDENAGNADGSTGKQSDGIDGRQNAGGDLKSQTEPHGNRSGQNRSRANAKYRSRKSKVRIIAIFLAVFVLMACGLIVQSVRVHKYRNSIQSYQQAAAGESEERIINEEMLPNEGAEADSSEETEEMVRSDSVTVSSSDQETVAASENDTNSSSDSTSTSTEKNNGIVSDQDKKEEYLSPQEDVSGIKENERKTPEDEKTDHSKENLADNNLVKADPQMVDDENKVSVDLQYYNQTVHEWTELLLYRMAGNKTDEIASMMAPYNNAGMDANEMVEAVRTKVQAAADKQQLYVQVVDVGNEGGIYFTVYGYDEDISEMSGGAFYIADDGTGNKLNSVTSVSEWLCSECKGSGLVEENACLNCKGSGFVIQIW